MKKLIPIAVATALLLTACGSGNYAATQLPAEPAPTQASTAPSTTAPCSKVGELESYAPNGNTPAPGGVMPAGSYMAKIKDRGRLIAGVSADSLHLGSRNPLTGQIEGFDIDMIRAVAKAIFGDPGKVQFKAISDDQRIPDTTHGTVDIVAHTMTITCDRLKMVDFSSVYFEAHQKVLVLKNSSATSLDDLHGQKVCATSGSDSLARISQHHAIPVKVTYWTDCLVRLQQGRVAAISTDDSILDGLAAQDPWTKIIGKPLTDEPYGLAISKQHPDFVRFVNAVLQQLRTDGQWKASYQAWLGHPVPNPPSAQYAG